MYKKLMFMLVKWNFHRFLCLSPEFHLFIWAPLMIGQFGIVGVPTSGSYIRPTTVQAILIGSWRSFAELFFFVSPSRSNSNDRSRILMVSKHSGNQTNITRTI